MRNDFGLSADEPSLLEPRYQKRLRRIDDPTQGKPLRPARAALEPLLQSQTDLGVAERSFLS